MADRLTRRELDLWRNFRFMMEETSLGVSRELLSATGMLGGQFGILSVLLDAPSHSMRQQHVADAMRWDRTRLSHQLTRMERSGWIQRKKSSDGVTVVVLTEAGMKQQKAAAPVLGGIVRRRF
jgi:DNA-binding MarR family transcriptional regulator